MLTPATQTALAVLNDISTGTISTCSPCYDLFPTTVGELLLKLEAGGLIQLKEGKDHNSLSPLSYRLTRPALEISLLDVLEATGEHLNCNHPTSEKIYLRHGRAAHKLGIINQITRSYLEEIKLVDL